MTPRSAESAAFMGIYRKVQTPPPPPLPRRKAESAGSEAAWILIGRIIQGQNWTVTEPVRLTPPLHGVTGVLWPNGGWRFHGNGPAERGNEEEEEVDPGRR